MSRINTNVASLIAVNNLNANNQSLQTSLQRLSTGYRINSGKDDPAGLIASENLQAGQRARKRRFRTPSAPTASSGPPMERSRKCPTCW